MPSSGIPGQMNSDAVTAVVLAAGEGKRLAPLTNTRPKPMVPVANKPILEHVLEALVAADVDEVVFVVGYQQERIRNHFGDGDDWSVDITYVEQSPQLGTGHAIEQVEDVVDDPFLVLNGDRIVEPSLIREVRDAMGAGGHVVSVTRVSHPTTLGVVTVRNNVLESIAEKPLDPAPTELINAGVYGFQPSIFDAIRDTDLEDGELAITKTLDELADEQDIPAIRYEGKWLDVTYLWDLPVVNAVQLGSSTSDAAFERTTIGEAVAVGDNVHVGPGATVRGGVAIGEHSRLGPSVTLENVVVLPDATIEAGAVLRDAIVGANAHVGPNVTIEGGPADVVVDDTVHREVDLGGVIGDNAEIGGGTILAPGAIVGNDTMVESGSVLEGRIDPDATVRRG